MTKAKHEVIFPLLTYFVWYMCTCMCVLFVNTNLCICTCAFCLNACVFLFFSIGITEYICHTEMLMRGRFMLVDLDEKMKPKLKIYAILWQTFL